jgi:transcriptional regulator with XRE-family HTH domain
MARTIPRLPLPEKATIDSQAEFGAFVRAQRSQLQLRIDDAASLCGVSVKLLSELENGKERSVSLDNVLKIATQLGIAIVAVPRTELPSVLSLLEKKG